MRHFFVASGIAWGHVRPLTALCIRLCKLNPDLHITLLSQRFLAKKVDLDRQRYDFDSVKERFHIIEGGLDRKEGLVSSEDYRDLIWKIGDETFSAYQSIVEGTKVRDVLTGKEVAPWSSKLDAVILDVTLLGAMLKILEACKDANPKPRVAFFFPIMAPAAAYNASNQFADIVTRVQSSSDPKEGYQKYVVESDIVHEMPGFHPFYQYELDPNVSTVQLYGLWAAMAEARPKLDLSIFAWPTVLGSKAEQVTPPPAAEKKRFSIGPQLPMDPTWTHLEASEEEVPGQVKKFLDRQQKENGDHSVVYISFGSLEFPPTKEQLWQFFDVLDELQIPYVMSQGMTPPDILEEIRERIANSGDRGMFVQWAPQVTILRHPATMAFMTHGGSNSAMEALLCGVPMIQWPHAWDQPMLANQMDYLGAAVELLQVRREHNIGRKTARGVFVKGTPEAIKAEMKETLVKLQGESGHAMRATAKELGDEVLNDMREGGEAYSDLKELAFLSAVVID